MTASIVHRITARNTARSSPNKIHDEGIARTYGFTGGLVPGVTIFAWMCGPPLEAYGTAWLVGGTIEARFVRPVYEGNEVLVEGTPEDSGLKLAVRVNGEIVATGNADLGFIAPEPTTFRRLPIPADPPPADEVSLAPGVWLGTVDVQFEAHGAREYLASIGADHSIPEGASFAHPGWLLLLANLSLSNNVALGPWIHVSSDVVLRGIARDGEMISAFPRVTDVFERGGHRFVDLDVLIVAHEDRPLASVHHRAIYEPRKALA